MVSEVIECTRCVFDTHDEPALTFTEEGICSHCLYYESDKKLFLKEGEDGEKALAETINRLKNYGRGRMYDCLIGLSGGIDSSYVAYKAARFGLRALCIHFDNGWNSEIAVRNIENIVQTCGFDLATYVIDWEEFKDLQLAYLKASVIDIEVLTDHAIYGSLFKIAKEADIKYVLGGHNLATEGDIPYHWTHNKKDYINIKAIHRAYGQRPLKTYPFLNRKMKRFIAGSGIEFINYLNWMPYVKKDAVAVLQKELRWKDYGGKHCESIWTRFYQGYILPVKFGVDKRKAHLAALINSGQITKAEALDELKKPPYGAEQLKADKDFVLKKLGLSEEAFEAYMKQPPRKHSEFDTEGSLFHYYPYLKPLRPLWQAVKAATGKKGLKLS